jgi:hypothetical protein
VLGSAMDYSQRRLCGERWWCLPGARLWLVVKARPRRDARRQGAKFRETVSGRPTFEVDCVLVARLNQNGDNDALSRNDLAADRRAEEASSRARLKSAPLKLQAARSPRTRTIAHGVLIMNVSCQRPTSLSILTCIGC